MTVHHGIDNISLELPLHIGKFICSLLHPQSNNFFFKSA